MPEALVRQWLILSSIPKAPPRISVVELERTLRDRGVAVHRRTIQRDLHELARVFPLVCDERTRPHGWRWADDAAFLCSIPILRDPRSAGVEIDLCVRAKRAVARAIAEGLRGRDGDARKVTTASERGGPGVVLHARVPDSCAMRRFLLGFGDAVEVLAPADVRREFEEKAARIAAVYDGRRSAMRA